jgi:hypothetical protein
MYEMPRELSAVYLRCQSSLRTGYVSRPGPIRRRTGVRRKGSRIGPTRNYGAWGTQSVRGTR